MKDEQRLEEIRKAMLELHFEKELILKKQRYEDEETLYKKVTEIAKKEKVNLEDIKYLNKCKKSVAFNHTSENWNYHCAKIDVSFMGKSIWLEHTEESEMYEGSWGDMEQDTISSFEFELILTQDVPCSFIRKEKIASGEPLFIVDVKSGQDKEYISLIFVLDETKLGKEVTLEELGYNFEIGV